MLNSTVKYFLKSTKFGKIINKKYNWSLFHSRCRSLRLRMLHCKRRRFVTIVILLLLLLLLLVLIILIVNCLLLLLIYRVQQNKVAP